MPSAYIIQLDRYRGECIQSRGDRSKGRRSMAAINNVWKRNKCWRHEIPFLITKTNKSSEIELKTPTKWTSHSELGHFPCYSLPFMQMSLWVFYAARFGSRFVWLRVVVGQSGSGQRPAVRTLFGQAVRTSPTFGICIWFSFPRFSLFFLFRSCFGPSKRATHATHGTNCVPNTLCTGPLTQFPVVPVPADSTLQLQLQALFHYEHAHSRS